MPAMLLFVRLHMYTYSCVNSCMRAVQENTSCLVVGVHASSELGYKEKNRFGRLFKDAIDDGVDGCEVMQHTHITLQVEPCLQGFDANVLRITTGKFDTFIDWLATRLTDVS